MSTPRGQRLRCVLAGLSLGMAWAGPAVAAEPTSPQVLMERGKQAESIHDIVTALRWYRKAAELGYAPAQARLGYILDDSEEDEEAVAWYRRAAAQGLPEAQYGLGKMYLSGEGVPANPDKARELFEQAARQGHVGAIQALAAAYEKGGLGLAPDYEACRRWLEAGIDAGDPWSARRLARAYRRGELGLPVDLDRAKALEVQARKQEE